MKSILGGWCNARVPGARGPRRGLALTAVVGHFSRMSPSVLERQLEVVRAMTPEQKIRASEALYLAAWDLKAAWLRSQHPDLPDDEIQEMVRRLFRDARG